MDPSVFHILPRSRYLVPPPCSRLAFVRTADSTYVFAIRGGGDAWRNYDEAFRRDAAARGLSDWSNMNLELFNIHTASVRVPRSPSRVQHAGSSTPSSSFFCRSWNSGRCTAFGRQCRYRHACDRLACGGRIDVFFVLLTSLRKLPSHTQRASSARLLFSQNVDIVNFSVTLSILRSMIFIQRGVGRVVRELHSSASLFF
jgi:hypothetical protein